MSDLIDRADAIRIASGYCHPANIAKELAKLPAVEPERKTGHWIECEKGFWSFVNEKGDRDGWMPGFKCSECESSGWADVTPFRFCPNCGADMREEREE